MRDKVFLTGISGFIAKHVAIELLNNGYEVIGTVRNKKHIKRINDTLAVEKVALDKLSFVELDLLRDNGWNKAIQGCRYLLHVASPLPIKSYKDKETLVPTAKGGTLRVLEAAVNAKVEHIVITSSVSSMYQKPNKKNPHVFGENDWTDTTWKLASAYCVSKTKAEKAAWDFMKIKGLENALTSVNPGLVFGPFLDTKHCSSMDIIIKLLQGKYPIAAKLTLLCSDVRDVAKTHILAMKNHKAGKRRLITGSEVKSMLEISKIIAEEFPNYAKKLPKREIPNFILRLLSIVDSDLKSLLPDLGYQLKTDTSYVEELLGLKFRSVKNSINASVNSVLKLGIVK